MQMEYRRPGSIGIIGLLLATLAFPVFAAQNTDRDITRQELLNFDRFLDSHPAIAQDLKKNPAVVNDSDYLSSHPELKNFLNAYPGVSGEIRENPRVFMNRERRFDRSGRDITRQELQNLDNFLDTHPNIEQDLKKDPKLLNDSSYLAAHPELKQFLDTHAGVRAEASEKPGVLMNRERQFENSGHDIPTAEVKSFDNFLRNNSAIGRELRKDPSLASNADYLAKHPELNTYLDQHPVIRQELAEHPRAVLRPGRNLNKKPLAQVKAERREERIERRETPPHR